MLLRYDKGNWIGHINKNIDEIFIPYQDKDLGFGSSGIVYRAFDLINKRDVAIKKIITYREKVIREIEILFKLNCKNIGKLYEVYNLDNFYYLILEYIPGKNLDQLIKKLDYHTIWNKFISQMLYTIEYLHGLNIVHCDIKLENIIYNKEKDLFVLLDFGFASPDEYTSGSYGYHAPEIFKNFKNYDHLKNFHHMNKRDIWCLGIALYLLITDIGYYDKIIDDRIVRNESKYMLFKDFQDTIIHTDLDEIKIFKLIGKCLIVDYDKRLDIKQLIRYYDELNFDCYSIDQKDAIILYYN